MGVLLAATGRVRKREIKMRKRIVIGVLAPIGVGVLVFVVSQPKKGTVEWHKKEYSALIDQIYGRRFVDRAREFIERNTGWCKRRNWQRQELALRMKAEVHRLALVETGDIAPRFFAVSNDNAVSRAVEVAFSKKGQKERALITCRVGGGGGAICVTGPSDDMAFWKDLIRKADAREK